MEFKKNKRQISPDTNFFANKNLLCLFFISLIGFIFNSYAFDTDKITISNSICNSNKFRKAKAAVHNQENNKYCRFNSSVSVPGLSADIREVRDVVLANIKEQFFDIYFRFINNNTMQDMFFIEHGYRLGRPSIEVVFPELDDGIFEMPMKLPELPFAGTCSDNGEIIDMHWYNYTTGANGPCSFDFEPFIGLGVWWETVPLVFGKNEIHFTATDDEGESNNVVVTVYNPSPTDCTVSKLKYKVNRKKCQKTILSLLWKC